MHRIFNKQLFIVILMIGIFGLALFFSGSHRQHHGMVWVPGGDFRMGSESDKAKPNERPAHLVHVDGFWMDETDVTNKQFAAFVNATGYVTTAEQNQIGKRCVYSSRMMYRNQVMIN